MEQKVQSYLSKLADELRSGNDAATAAFVDESLRQYQLRHWHEMSVALLHAVNSPGVLAHAYELHDNVLTIVRADISPIAYVKLVQAVAFSPESTLEKALHIVEGAQACFVGQDSTQGRHAAQCIRAMLLLQANSSEPSTAATSSSNGTVLATSTSATTPGGPWSTSSSRQSANLAAVPGSGPHTARKILEEVESYTRSLQMHEVEPVLLAMLCRARGRDYELRGQYTRYYVNAFDIVTYAEKASMTIPAAEMRDLAFTAAVAALLSEHIFTFGKLLNFRAFSASLAGTVDGAGADHGWIVEWMRKCNDGDVNGFEDFTRANTATIERQAQILLRHGEALGRKVRLMALLHLVFYTPFNERTFAFSTIAARCGVPESDAEPLLLAALAQGIVRGKIDGLLQQVHITWVEPRVLSLLEVKELATHVSGWRENATKLSAYVSDQTKHISK